MSRLNDIKKMFIKEKKKEIRDDSFLADKGRWTYTVTSIIPKSRLIDFYNSMKRKAGNVTQKFGEIEQETWEVDKDTLIKFEKKIIKDICSFDEIVEQVKEDLPDFKVISWEVNKMAFSTIDKFSYKVKIELKGACMGD